MNIGAYCNQVSQFLDIVSVDSLREGKVLSYVNGNHDFINSAVWIWGDDSTSGKIYSFT